MKKENIVSLSTATQKEFLAVLQKRCIENRFSIKKLIWKDIQQKLINTPQKLWSLYEMERTGGEPALTAFDEDNDIYTFTDCSPESPIGRRSLCYDKLSLDTRKENKPIGNALEMADAIGITILDEKQYKALQLIGKFDQKTSSWLNTPKAVRDLGGAIFGDYRYDRAFIYHNGASSYYAARGFRGFLFL